jgi:hypothetical protein
VFKEANLWLTVSAAVGTEADNPTSIKETTGKLYVNNKELINSQERF